MLLSNLVRIEVIQNGLSLSGLSGLSTLGNNTVLEAVNLAGIFPQNMRRLRILIKISNGTLLSSLGDIPSGPETTLTFGRAEFSSKNEIGFQRLCIGSLTPMFGGETSC